MSDLRLSGPKRHKNSKKLGYERLAPPTPRRDFDYDSGQVYTEVEVSFRSKQSSDWIGEFKTPKNQRKPSPATSGARSLLDVAKSKAVECYRSFTVQHFESIPWALASTIWEETKARQYDNIHLWRTLASAYAGSDEMGKEENGYHLEIRNPSLSLTTYFQGLSCSSFKWLSILRLSPVQISAPDLIAIAHINNLAILDLSDGQPLSDSLLSAFDERIWRTWSELATAGRAFQQLRVMMLGWQNNISTWIFEYLDHYPKLQFFVVTDCRYIHQKNRAEWESIASAHGWTAHHGKRSVKLLRPLLEDKFSPAATITKLYHYSLGDYQDTQASAQSHFNTFKATIECCLGTPRRWTHILEEFPGTRTVLFSKPGESRIPEPVKRNRDFIESPGVIYSPPRKKSEIKSRRAKMSTESAASLLKSLGA